MEILRVAWLSAFWQRLRAERVELTPTFAIAGLLLVIGDIPLRWIASWFAPGWAARAATWPSSERALWLGLPLALAFLVFAFHALWRSMYRPAPSLPLELLQAQRIEPADSEPLLSALEAIAAAIPRIPFEYSLERLRDLPQWSGRFDPQRWFAAYRHLRPKPGMVLDFVYHYWGNGGFPLLYLRHGEEPRLADCDAYWKRFGGSLSAAVAPNGAALAPWIEWERTPIGAFEYALFALSASQFHRHWHNADGFPHLVTSAERLARCLDSIPLSTPRSGRPALPWAVSAADVDHLRALDPRPEVRIAADGSRAEVRLLRETPGVCLEQLTLHIGPGGLPAEAGRDCLLRYGSAPVP